MWKAGANCAPSKATLTAVHGVAVSGDGRLAVSASADKTLKVWDVDSGEALATFTCDGEASAAPLSTG